MLHVRTVPVLISGSMFIGLDLTSTDRAKRMKGVFLSGRHLFTDFYGTLCPEAERFSHSNEKGRAVATLELHISRDQHATHWSETRKIRAATELRLSLRSVFQPNVCYADASTDKLKHRNTSAMLGRLLHAEHV